MNLDELESRLRSAASIYIYGAGIVAFGAYKAVQCMFGLKPKCFLVTDLRGEVRDIDGVSVVEFSRAVLDKNCLVIVATPEAYHADIVRTLRERGVHNYLLLDADMEYLLMGQYLKRETGLRLIEDYPVYGHTKSEGDVCVYMAVCHVDKALKRKYKEEPWVRKIQVGAVRTEARIAALTDEACGEVSQKNYLYSELSAAYYAWRYGKHDVTGLFHYRRVLDVTREQLSLLAEGTLDAILPLPYVCDPDASGQYRRYIMPHEEEIMWQVLRNRKPEAYERLVGLPKTPYLYNYNMLIARKETYDDYCGWLFPLLQEIERVCEEKRGEQRPRYISWIGEVLTSLYFMDNEKRWKIAHAKKIWRV